MENQIKQIYEDDREIERIYWDDVEDSCLIVGSNGHEKIVAYGENGEFCSKSHLAVYMDGEIRQRIPATSVRIVYKKTVKEQ